MTRLLDWKGHAFVALSARLYLAFVFLFACAHKILDPGAFALDIATYQILPLELVNLMALILPWIELASGTMLAVGWRTRAAALLISAMMLTFTIAIALALHKGLDMSCGCFASEGAADDPISWLTLMRDLGWLMLGLYVVAFDRAPLGLDRWFGRPHAT